MTLEVRGEAVETEYDPRAIPPAPEVPELLTAVLSGHATDDQRRRFAQVWQARVNDILAGDPERVVRIRRVEGGR